MGICMLLFHNNFRENWCVELYIVSGCSVSVVCLRGVEAFVGVEYIQASERNPSQQT